MPKRNTLLGSSSNAVRLRLIRFRDFRGRVAAAL